MTRVQVVYLQACVVLTAGTGMVFAWMKYAIKSADPFAVINHPWQPYMLSAHVVLAPLLVFAFGWIFNEHIWAKFRNSAVPQRGTGIWSMAAIVPMILSGYFIQVSAADATRHAMAVAHWISSALFVLAYGVHVITKPPRPETQRPED